MFLKSSRVLSDDSPALSQVRQLRQAKDVTACGHRLRHWMLKRRTSPDCGQRAELNGGTSASLARQIDHQHTGTKYVDPARDVQFQKAFTESETCSRPDWQELKFNSNFV